MTILEFLKLKKKCTHPKVRPDVDLAYCPDCGVLIKNQWYLVRCSCCGVKLKAVIKNDGIVSESHFCHNCGCRDFVVEKINKISFIDISYAVLLKTVVKSISNRFTQSWVDNDFRTSNYRPLLLQRTL